jgi:surface polysaccharide O-acyltransferase-like enzyme
LTPATEPRFVLAAQEPSERLFFLDWLRIIAFIVLVAYHVGMYYVTWDFHVKSPFASHALEPWMKLTEPWRMSLLFMISGAATAFMLKGTAANTVMRRRTRQLLLPLLCGVLLVVPPQAYWQVVQQQHYTGNYLDFLSLYFSGYRGFCEGARCLILPTWNHLWFLAYVWTYTLLAWVAVSLWPSMGTTQTTSTGKTETLLHGLGWLMLPLAWLWLIRVLLFARFPETHALVDDGYNHALYLFMFAMGMVMAQTPSAWPRFTAWRWATLVAAVLCWATLVSVRPAGWTGHAVVAGFQWTALVAVLGFAQRHLNRDHPWRQHLSDAVFPVYVFHQTILIGLSQWLLPLGWLPRREGPALVTATLLLSYLAYRAVLPFPRLRPWFGVRKADAKVP